MTQNTVRSGDQIFRQPCVFLRGCPSLEFLPPMELPEIAFVGRSNVGKSSLINALLGQNNMARTSNTPGRTQELNFFQVGDAFVLVDLPGYGYAKAPVEKVKAWTEVMKQYLRGRVSLRRVYVLIDARHGVKENDTDFMKMLDEAAVSYQMVVTKCDKIKEYQLEKLKEKLEEEISKHTALFPMILYTSSHKEVGLSSVRQAIIDIALSTAALSE